MRNIAHVVDTKSIKQTLNLIPNHWVVRDLSERDYGIDLLMEIFREVKKDKNEHAVYDTTGSVCNLQIKGTDAKLKKSRKTKTINLSMEVKALKYMEKFSTPFILIRVSNYGDGEAYFVWIQGYIEQVLDIEKPEWREKKKFSIRIPVHNKLEEANFEKLEKIASMPKYREELLEFSEIYTDIANRLDSMAIGKHSTSDASINEAQTKLKRISRFETLFARNDSQVGANDINQCIKHLENSKGIKSFNDINEYPNKHNLDLLNRSAQNIYSIEAFIEENENQTVY